MKTRSARRRTSTPTSTTTRKRKKTSTTKPEPRGRLTPVALALGGNVGGNRGPVEQTLCLALRQLQASLGPLQVASLYRSAPASSVPQPDYLNTAALAYTALAPDAVLALAKALERAAGRRRGVRFGPRPLDVDVVLYGGETSGHPELSLPHPRLRERRFVLEPLSEIAPDWPVPPDGATVRELLDRLAPAGPGSAIERIGWSPTGWSAEDAG